jgi:hypothetical protein
VEVEVVVQFDGTFLARKIEIEQKRRQDGRGREQADARSIEIEGVIESIAAEHWLVADYRVRVGLDTRISGQVAAGAFARVEGVRQTDGTIVATRIIVTPGEPKQKTDDEKRRKEKGDSLGDNEPREGGEPKNQVPKEGKKHEPPPEGVPPEGKGDREDRVQIKGTLNELGVNGWVVSGQTIVLTAETAIVGKPVVGAIVEVEGVRQPNGSILAKKVKLQLERSEEKEGRQEAKPTPTPKATPNPTPISTPRQKAAPTATPPPTATPTPKPTARPTPTPKPAVVRFQGMVEGIQGLEWRVSGRTVLVNTATQIEGIAVVGSKVRIEGVQREGGTVLATLIKVLGASD